MDSENFDIDFLARETFALTEALQKEREEKKQLDSDSLFELEEKEEEPIEQKVLFEIEGPLLEVEKQQNNFLESPAYPPTSGVIYRVETGGATFCIRGFAVENLREGFKELERGEDVSMWEVLRLPVGEESEISLQFFSVEEIEYADVIVDQVFNRRFPIDEDTLCNLSDPGFSWWFEEFEGGFSIHFKSYGLDRNEQFVRLGPLSDLLIAKKRLLQAEDMLRSYFPISEFSCDEKTFRIASVKKDHLSFEFLKGIFLDGENHSGIDQFPDTPMGRTLFYYFKELAAVRGFWIGIQEELGL